MVIPAYNAELWLPFTLQAACNQTLRDIEILVVDDGSRDGTAAVALDHAARDARIRLIQTTNGGVGAARNSGIREARGRFIAPLDADDLWHPDKLEEQVACMEAGGEEMGLVYCWLEKIDATGGVITASFPWEIEGRVLRPLILRNFLGNASVPLFRRSALDEVGLYLEAGEQGGSQGCEDWDLAIRLAEKFTFGLVRRSLVGYRQLEDCMSLQTDWMGQTYEITMDRAKARNPGLDPEVFRWSAGNFYSYLVSKCYVWGNYRGCLDSIFRAVSADPMLVINRKFHAMGLKSVIRLMSGTRGNIPSSGNGSDAALAFLPPGKSAASWSERVQAKRWAAAQSPDEKPDARKRPMIRS